MAKPIKERRSEPRIPFYAHAYVFCHNRKHICQIINMSCRGALLTPPIHLKVGTYVRLNLKLPQLDDLIDVDAVVVRDTNVRGCQAWGVSFVSVSERADVLMRTFVDWVIEQNRKRPVTGKHMVNIEASAAGGREDDVTHWVDNLDLERLFREALGSPVQRRKKRAL